MPPARKRYEVEVKIELHPDELEGLRRRLRELGARLLSRRREHDIYFEHPCRSLHENDEVLRLRVAEGRALLTYKSASRPPLKTREEIEVRVDDAQALRSILQHLGFSESLSLSKLREEYSLDREGVKVCIDHVKGLGYYLEVEARSENPEEAERRIRRVLSTLGLEGRPLITTSYAELLRAGGRKP